MGLEKDLPPAEQLLVLFRPFLEYLAASDLSPKTIQKHVDNMWALGGEFIRDLHSDSSLRKKPVERILLQMIEYGGPLSTRWMNMQILSGASRIMLWGLNQSSSEPRRSISAHARKQSQCSQKCLTSPESASLISLAGSGAWMSDK